MKISTPVFSYVLVLWCLGETAAFAPVATRSNKISHTQLFGETKKLEGLAQKTPGEREVKRLLNNYGERSRRYRRDVFTAADWIRVRRPERFVDNILSTFQSGLIRQVSFEVTFIAMFAFFVVTYNNFFFYGWDFFGHHDPVDTILPKLVLPLTPFTLSSSALGLLLTFRTNVSYARWNEARTAWGKIINDSRSIMRMGCTWAKSYNNINGYELQKLGEAVCSFSRAVMNRTLPPQEDEENFKKYTRDRLSDEGYGQDLRAAKHRPTAALAEITSILVEFNLNPLHQVEVEKVVTGLCDALGASERIFTSPVPTFYTRHTARFLAVWLALLPTGIYEAFAATPNHSGVIPAIIVISAFFLGIEELATQMEEPFSILPMEKMCEGSIRTPVMEQVERSQNERDRSILTLEPQYYAPAPAYEPAPAAAQAAPANPNQVFGDALSQSDMEKLGMYFPDGQNGSVEEMNRRWAQGSTNGTN